MCDGGRVGANQRRASDSRSRLTAWLATGVPCAQPGRDVDRKRKTLFQACWARSAQEVELLEDALAAALDFRGLGRGRGERLEGRARGGKGRRGEERGRHDHSRTAEGDSSRGSRRTLGFCSADSSPSSPFASAGGVCLVCRGATTLRPTYAPNLPTFGPTLLVTRYSLLVSQVSNLANVDCRVVLNPQWRMDTIRAYHQQLLLLFCSRSCVCTTLSALPPVHHRSSQHARRAGH
jgi:hypothetical protein